jgi:hypothetical protein
MQVPGLGDWLQETVQPIITTLFPVPVSASKATIARPIADQPSWFRPGIDMIQVHQKQSGGTEKYYFAGPGDAYVDQVMVGDGTSDEVVKMLSSAFLDGPLELVEAGDSTPASPSPSVPVRIPVNAVPISDAPFSYLEAQHDR